MLLDLLESQVIALRASVDAMHAAIMAAKGETPAAVDERQMCPHGETENVGTFGAPDIRCKACGEQVAA